RLELRCAAGPRRQATCLTIWDDAPANAVAGDTIVERCRFHVGHMQVGVLVVNQWRATVADNYVETYVPLQDAIVKITTSPAYLAMYRRLIAKDIMVSQPGIDHAVQPGFSNLNFAVGQTRVLFRADSALGPAWDQALKQIAPKAFNFLGNAKPVAVTPAANKRGATKKAAAAKTAVADNANVAAAPAAASARASFAHRPALVSMLATPKGTTRPLQKQLLKVRKRMDQLAYAVLTAATDANAKTTLTPAQLKPFKDWIAAQQNSFVAVASAGIVIAGQVGGDLRVTDNTVIGALDGIHLGFSHHVEQGADPDVAQRVQVIGNTVSVRVTAEITRGTHRGIFVGNAWSAAIQRNRVTVTFPFANRQSATVYGILVAGSEGNSFIVGENDVTGATVGVRFWVDQLDRTTKPLWLVIHNATFGCPTSIQSVSGVIETGNMP
ncbi:MAG TPA: hypothetical protein VIV58_08240, partial [Kofleriaceae bacterium]